MLSVRSLCLHLPLKYSQRFHYPEDAKKLGIKDKEPVKVSSRRGDIQVKALVTDRIKPGVVFIPFHYAEAAANVLTNPALDPVAKIPEFKVCAVKIEKAG